jgi:hypothetical protein
MSRRGLILLLICLAIVWGLELLADLHLFPGIWWTHAQAMNYGGWAFIGVALLVLLLRR